jgi:hypothetical protein
MIEVTFWLARFLASKQLLRARGAADQFVALNIDK